MDDDTLGTQEDWTFRREREMYGDLVTRRQLRTARLYHLAFWVLLGTIAGGLVAYGTQADGVRQTWLGLATAALLVGATWAAVYGILTSWTDMQEYAS